MQSVTQISVLGLRLGVVVLLCFWTAMAIGTHLPTTLDFSPDISDKVKHFSAFFGLATLLCYVTTSSKLVGRFAAILLVCSLYAAIDEWTQQYVAGRVCDVWDFVADVAGATSAIVVYASVRYVARQRVVNWFRALTSRLMTSPS